MDVTQAMVDQAMDCFLTVAGPNSTEWDSAFVAYRLCTVHGWPDGTLDVASVAGQIQNWLERRRAQ